MLWNRIDRRSDLLRLCSFSFFQSVKHLRCAYSCTCYLRAMTSHSKMVVLPKETPPPPPGGWSNMAKQPTTIQAMKGSMDKVADVVLPSINEEIAKKAKTGDVCADAKKDGIGHHEEGRKEGQAKG